MNNFRIDLLFLLISIFTFTGSKRSALRMIKTIGIYPELYPKGYKKPVKWMKKLFKIQEWVIPWFAYYELMFSILFLILGPVNIFISRVFLDVPNIVGVLIMFNVGLFFIVGIMSTIGYLSYKKRIENRKGR